MGFTLTLSPKWGCDAEVNNMFKTKLVSSITTPKPLKPDNVRVNVVVTITIHNQQLKQMLKERELVKAKRTKYWQQEDYL